MPVGRDALTGGARHLPAAITILTKKVGKKLLTRLGGCNIISQCDEACKRLAIAPV